MWEWNELFQRFLFIEDQRFKFGFRLKVEDELILRSVIFNEESKRQYGTIN